MNNQYKKIQQAEGYMSANPLPSAEELNDFYAKLYYQKSQSTSYKEEYSEEELEYKDLKSKCLLRALSLANCKKETFLDIGAGEGFLMNIAAKDGFLVNGIDFSSYGINKFFPQLSDKLIEGDIYEVIKDMVSIGTKFTACAAINVLEHVIDPVLFLATIKPIIQPEGLLAITVPNDFSDFQSLLINENFIDREFWFSPPQHLHYFNTKNIVTFCDANGYELVDAYSDFPIDYFLLHPGSNYIVDKGQGKAAHKARILHDLMIAKGGIDRYLDLYRAMFNVGIGRDITVILRIKKE